MLDKLVCEECGRVGGENERGWRAYLAGGDDDNEALEVLVFCPPCAEREFAAKRRSH